jgi:hypothetical protein
MTRHIRNPHPQSILPCRHHPSLQVFHLLPPCDAYRLALASLPTASFQPQGQGHALVPVLEEGGGRVTWSPVDPEPRGGC